MTKEEVDMKLTQGVIQKWQVILHDSAVYFVMQLVTENPAYFN